LSGVPIRVLCIDDDARLFELLAKYLGDSGIRLEHAAQI
jgi:DNA-binding response OmpR family regulator